MWHSHRPGTGGDAALRKIAEKVAALDEPEAERPQTAARAKTTPESKTRKAAPKAGPAAPKLPSAKPRAAKAGGKA